MNGKKTLGIVLMAAALLLPARVNAQKIIDWWSFNTGVDTSLWIDISGSYSTIIAGGNRTSAASGLQDIGFSFTCGALTHTKFSTNINGTVRLGNTSMPASGYYTQPLGQNINTGPKIEPYGWLGRFDSTCYTKTALVGDSGSRVRVIETRMMNYSVPYTDSLYFTFQVQMFENGGIRIVYGHTDSGAINHQTQNGIDGRGPSSDKDVVFFDFATQTVRRFNDNCTLYNAEGTWPVEGRWYMMAPDSNMCTYSVVTVTASNNAPDNVVLTNNNGGANDLRIVIPAVGLDTLWPATDSTLSLNRTFNPNTVYTGTVLRYCSNGQLSYRGNDFSFTTACGPVSELPWLCDFTETISTNCWDMSPYTTTNNKWSKQNGALGFIKAMRCGNTSSQTYDEWLQTPVFTLPDTNGLTIKWDYRSDLLNGVAPTVDVRVAPCTADGTVADSAWTTLMTLNEEVASAKTYYLSLDAYRGQTIRVAFVRTGTGGKYAALDNIMLYLQHVPIVELEAPISASMDDTVAFTARMITGIDSNVVWTWHSTLMDTTIVVNNLDSTACVLNFTYTTSGADTMSVVLSNAYGADTATAIVWVADCNAVSNFPWVENFSTYNYVACWIVNGWQKTANGWWHDESNTNRRYYNLMNSNAEGSYMLSPAIALPASGMHNMKLWVECQPKMMVRLSATASTDTADYTDTLLVVNHNISQGELWWQVADLEPYAGQTVRIGFFKMAGTQSYINQVKIDHDTLPVLFAIDGQSSTMVDSVTKFTASLRRGATESLHYTWSSSHGGIISVNALGDSMTVTYPSGSGNFVDTLTVVVANAFGSDTASKTVRVVDCTPALTLPWLETFADGDVCWYKPEGCKFYDAIPYNDSYYEHLRHLYLNTRYDTLGSWIISKEIQLPTGITPTLRWKAASSNSGYHHLYSVLVTTAAEYTDTANYTLLYTDSTTHPNFSNYDNHSASLAQYEGQTIHIAFHNHPWHMAPSAIGLYIDDVEVSASYEPHVMLSAVGAGSSPTYAYGDTAILEATLEEGSTAGLSFTWHSTLLDSTWVTTGVTAQSRLAYGLLGGTDTVSVIATNNYGSDTATVYTYSYIVFEPSITNFVAEGLDILQGDNEVETGDTTIYAITRAYSVTLGQTYSLRSSLMDTTVTVATNDQTCRIPLVYNVTGRDTVTAIITTLYGSDTATMQVQAVDCPTVGVPYLNTFDDSTDCHCWPGNWVAQGGRATSLNGPTWLVSPTIDIPADTPGVQFKWTTYDINTAMGLPIRLLVSPTGSKDHAMFTDTIMDGYTPYGAPDSVSLDAYLGQRIRVALVTNLQSRAYTFDNISIDYNRTVPQVTLSAPAETTIPDSVSYTATLNGCSSYDLNIVWHSCLLDTTVVSPTLAPFALAYTIGGVDTVTIIASNHYGADTAVAVVNVVDCNGRPVPFFEDFEGVAPTTWNVEGNLPLCWTAVSNGTNAAYAPHVIANNGYSYISNLPNNALFMVAGGSTYGNPADVVLPRFAAPLNTLSIAFDYRFESASYGALTVGYYSDTTFTAVDTLTPHAGSYQRDTVYFNSVSAPMGSRIALRFTKSGTFYGLAIDNIEVFSDNPLHVAADSVTASCASLVWTAIDSATAYRVLVDGVIDTVVADTALTVCGLDDNTSYIARVAAIVGGDTGDYAVASFRTLFLCAPLASVAVSEDGVISWQHSTEGYATPTGVIITITDTASGVTIVTDTAYGTNYIPTGMQPFHTYRFVVTTLCGSINAHGSDTIVVTLPAAVCYEVRGPHSESYRFIDGYSKYNYNQMLYPASMVGTVDTLYGIAFRVTEQNRNQYRTVDIYLGHTSATSLSSPVSATGLTQVADNHQYSIADTGWSRILFDTPFVYDGVSNLIVTMVDISGFDAPFEPGTGMHAPQAGESFLYYSASFSSQPTPDPYTLNFTAYTYSWIPDIQLLGGCNYNQCLSPWVSVAGTTPHSVTLAWQQRGQENLWQVEYRADSGDPWIVSGTTASVGYTITGLSIGSSYQVRVASLCGSDTLYGDILSVGTDCDTVSLPYHTDFTLGYYPCWNVNAYTWETFSGIRISPGSSNNYKVISPAVNVPMSNVKVTVRALNPYNDSQYSTNNASYAVGVCDSNDVNTVWIDTVAIVQRHVLEERTIFLHNYSGAQHHIIVRPVQGTSEVHSITLDLISGCLPVQNVRVSQLTDTSATVTWVPEDATNTFAVYLDGALMGITTGTSLPLSSLTPGTQYTAAVREICSLGDTAMAIGCLFQTACAATNVPYFEGFGNSAYQEDVVGTPYCWTLQYNIATGYQTVYYDPELHLYSSPYTDSNVANFLCSPLLRVGSHGGIVRFKGKAGFAGVAGNVKVGVMTNISDTASFIHMVTVTPGYGNTPLQWYEFSTDSISLPDVWAVAFRWTGGAQGAFDSLFVEAIPVTTYDITLGVNDTSMGSVTGGGTYEEGTLVNFAAIPYDGYRFVTWSDSVTDAVREIIIRQDLALTAYFAADSLPPTPDTVWRTVTVLCDNTMGSVTGGGTYMDSSTVTITATPLDGYLFDRWDDGDTTNPRNVFVVSDTTFTAYFRSSVGISELRTQDSELTIFPNPSHGDVTISMTNALTNSPINAFTISIIDIQGRTVIHTTTTNSTFIIPHSTLTSGTYFVRATTSEGCSVSKLIVE